MSDGEKLKHPRRRRGGEDRAELDGLFRDLLRFHWLDEAQHAKIDSLQLLELGGAVDGLLSPQADLDVQSLERALGRTFSSDDKVEIKAHSLRPTVGHSSSRGWSIRSSKLKAVAKALAS